MAWITAHDVQAETWRYLMEFANPEYAMSILVEKHGAPTTPSMRRNYQKQARQLRATLLQAREYFYAADAATAATSPNHLYYGLVSLATAVMLLRANGTKSLDYLRRDSQNLTHGLRFTTGATESSAQSGLVILAETRVEICATGHFANWYETLPGTTSIFGIEKRVSKNAINTNRALLGTDKRTPLAQLLGAKYDLLQLVRTLPDLFQTLNRYKAGLPSSRVSYECEFGVPYQKGDVITTRWTFHGAGTPGALLALLEHFKVPARLDSQIECRMQAEASNCTVVFRTNELSEHCSFPSMREDMNLNIIAYPMEYLQFEFVDAYLLSYGLSMLARYHPDIWIAALESHCISTKIIERFVDVMMLRGPILAARLLVDSQLVISSHSPPWFT